LSVADGVQIGFGAVIVLVTLYDVFQSVVMPSQVTGAWSGNVVNASLERRVWPSR
jgi:hypothetical protein